MTPTPNPPDLWLFFVLVLGVIVLPGMDMAYVAGSALVGGLRAGFAAVAGIMAGGLVHVGVAMTGIAALLALWPAAFDALLVAGATYMAWVGWQILQSTRPTRATRDEAAGIASVAAVPSGRAEVFGRAVLTCLGNPKAYAFSLAVFPAFVRGGTRPLALQGLLLAAIVVSTQALVYGAVAAMAAGTRRAVGGADASRRIARVIGPLLMAGALLTVLAGWRSAHAAEPSRSSSAPSGGSSMTTPDIAPGEPIAVPSAIARNAPPAAETLPASRDFDFLMGDWSIENRKRLGILSSDDRWESFHAESHVRPLPAGTGNRDDYTAAGWRPDYVGVTVRVFSPQTRQWSLYWTNNHGAGLDPATGLFLPPVVGGFSGDTGIFEGDDTWDGRPIRCRYTWRRIDADHARWEQAFSPDAGRTWETHWTMDLTRIDPVATMVRLEGELDAAFLHADLAALDRLLAADFTFVNGRGDFADKRDTLEELRSGRVHYTAFATRVLQARVVDYDTAFVHGITHVAGVSGGRDFAADVRFTDVFVQHDGRWTIHAGQSSSALPPDRAR